MGHPLTWRIGSYTNTAVTVGNTTTAILAAEPSRMHVVIVNDSDEAVYLAFGADAVLNSGVRLNASGGSYEMNPDNLYAGAINGICTSGQKVVTVVEGIK